MKRQRIYAYTCIYCGVEGTATFRIPKEGMGCGANPACNAAHNAQVSAYQAEVSRRRSEAQRNRQPRRYQPLYGDLAAIAAFNGIATDGSGRKAGRRA